MSGSAPGALRIGIVAWRDLAHPQAGGSEVLVDRLARGCVERGHDVALMCGGPVARRPYPVLDLGGAYAQYLRAPLAHARALADRDVLVDVENGIPFFAPLWRRRPVVCLVHHVHAEQWRLRFRWPLSSLGWALERRAMPEIYRRTPFIAVSPSTAAALRDLGVDGSRIALVHNGVDLAAEPPPAKSGGPLFLALGRLVRHKRVDLVLRVWDRVRERTGGRLVVAGTGPELERLRRLAGPGVELRGAVSDGERDRLLAEAWLLVHGALHEGWGMVVMEAAAAGTPALAFDVPGVRDAVRRGETGVLVRDEAALADAWVALTADPALRQRLGAAARRRARAFTWERSVDAFLEVLRAAAGDPRRAAFTAIDRAAA